MIIGDTGIYGIDNDIHTKLGITGKTEDQFLSMILLCVTILTNEYVPENGKIHII